MTANELHIPVSDPAHPTPTFLTLLSADTDHSFWVPRLAGKTDLIPNHPNSMWMDPHETGLYLGPVRAILRNPARQDAAARLCADSREDFDRWVQEQSQPAQVSGADLGRAARSSNRRLASTATPSQAPRRTDASAPT